ncbi:MAG TPA: hypothetical protein DHV36_13300, partial [Desulfobacteraceae bacterium]|nr:hypothetical protein [Desulfobacteraceae bacterium]
YLTTGPMESYKVNGFGLFCVVLKTDDTPIGTCGLLKRDFLDYPDLGYAFLPEFRSRGYAGEASAGVLYWGKKTFDLQKIGAIVNSDNQASIRLLERIGFSYEKEVTIPETKKLVKLLVAEL